MLETEYLSVKLHFNFFGEEKRLYDPEEKEFLLPIDESGNIVLEIVIFLGSFSFEKNIFIYKSSLNTPKITTI